LHVFVVALDENGVVLDVSGKDLEPDHRVVVDLFEFHDTADSDWVNGVALFASEDERPGHDDGGVCSIFEQRPGAAGCRAVRWVISPRVRGSVTGKRISIL